MYAEDFAGEADSTAEYRRGVLRFVAEHTGLALSSRSPTYEVVYNIYDWGLNDSHRDPRLRPIRFHESVETFHEADPGLRELYLYDGNFCNRDCSWCTVFGSPKGWHVDYGAPRARRGARRTWPPTATSSSTAASRRCTPTGSSRRCATSARAASAASSRSSPTA